MGLLAPVVSVRDLHGDTLALDACGVEPVGLILARACARSGLSPHGGAGGVQDEGLRLCYRGSTLDPTWTLAQCGVAAEATLELTGQVRGGGGKKKKAKVMPKVKPLEKTRCPTVFLCLFCDHKTVTAKM
eukprot:COSAG01_NODE_4423_length_5036_cov_22.765445_2_plen_130_part_00